MPKSRELMATPFLSSPYAKKLRDILQLSCPLSRQPSAPQLDEELLCIGGMLYYFVRFKTEGASVNEMRTYRIELRKYGKLIQKLASVLRKPPTHVVHTLIAARAFDEEIEQTVNEDLPVDKYHLEGIYRLVSDCADVLINSGSMASAGRHSLEDEHSLIENLIERWELLTGRIADGTKKEGALARDGYPCFRSTAEIIREYINCTVPKQLGNFTTENMNTVIDRFIRLRRESIKRQ